MIACWIRFILRASLPRRNLTKPARSKAYSTIQGGQGMKKEISPVTAAIVILVVLAVIVIAGWRYFFAEPAVVPIDPNAPPPVGGPGVAPGMVPGGAPGAPAPQGAPTAPQSPPASGQ
jgi:hypothetical protein